MEVSLCSMRDSDIFGARAVFSMHACFLFAQCLLAVE